MYGLIGQIITAPGKRDDLAALLVPATRDMPGCHSYVIAADEENPDALWVTEVWASKEHHQASLGLPAVQEAIQAGRSLIAGFGVRHETVPVAASVDRGEGMG